MTTAEYAVGTLAAAGFAAVLYKVDQFYAPEHDRGIAWNDPDIGIEWPVSAPILSDKDRAQPRLKDAENNFFYAP